MTKFKQLVKQMRDTQKRYFKTRCFDVLEESRKLEKEVDRQLDEMTTKPGELASGDQVEILKEILNEKNRGEMMNNENERSAVVVWYYSYLGSEAHGHSIITIRGRLTEQCMNDALTQIQKKNCLCKVPIIQNVIWLEDNAPCTNGDRIRAMSNERLAQLIVTGCPKDEYCDKQDSCLECIIDWLKDSPEQEELNSIRNSFLDSYRSIENLIDEIQDEDNDLTYAPDSILEILEDTCDPARIAAENMDEINDTLETILEKVRTK